MSNFFQYKFENPNAEPKYKLKEDFSGNVIAIPTIFSHKPRHGNVEILKENGQVSSITSKTSTGGKEISISKGVFMMTYPTDEPRSG